MADTFADRVRSQLKLALLGDCGCERTLADLDREARTIGLTGAEIDAALAGRSFEARTAAAISFACAIKAGDRSRMEAAHARAMRLGVSCSELAEVADEAARILAGGEA